MSEYTSYRIVHVDDLAKARDNLTQRQCTSALIVDFDHPLFEEKDPENAWNHLAYTDKWVILMMEKRTDWPSDLFPRSVYLMVDENPERWSIHLDHNSENREFLFSDSPWGDMCDPDPKKDWQRIENANTIGDADIKIMEDLFQVSREHFADYLRMGQVWHFLKAVKLPAVEMLCDWLFYYPAEVKGKCLLWKEYMDLVD